MTTPAAQPDPTRVLDEFLDRLDETIRWCRPRVDPRNPARCLRSAELRPVEGPPSASVDFQSVVSRRAALLGPRPRGEVRPDAANLDAGGLLGFYHMCNNLFGLSLDQSGGYIDAMTEPPWDTWVMLIEGASPTRGDCLVCWVHEELRTNADGGIDVCVEGCIGWLDDEVGPLWQELRRRGLPPSAE